MAGSYSLARIHDTANRSIFARSKDSGAGSVRGTAELPLGGAYAAREAVAVVGLDAAVATEIIAGSLARVPCLRAIEEDFISIGAMNEFVAVCRACLDEYLHGRGRAVDDDANEDEDHGVRTEEHTETNE